MKLGAYTAVLHDRPIAAAPAVLADLRSSKDARDDHLGLLAAARAR